MKDLDLSGLLGIWFHDVSVERISIDYLRKEATFEIAIPVGFWNTPNRYGKTDGRVEGRLTFTDLLFLVMEPPDQRYDYATEGLEITGEGAVSGTEFKSPVPTMPSDIPDNAFHHWFYVGDWNSFIFIAATGVHFDHL